MTETDITDIKLMMLADGKLNDREARDLRSRIANDPDLAVRYADFVETRALLEPQGHDTSTAHDETGAADSIAAAIRATAQALENGTPVQRPAIPRERPVLNVIEGGGTGTADQPSAQRITGHRAGWRLPLAAALAFAIGGLGGYLLHNQIGPQGTSPGIDLLASRPGLNDTLQQALTHAASSTDVAWSDLSSGSSGRIHILSSHRLGDGALCREYEIRTARSGDARVLGASCRRDGRWNAEIALALPGTGTGYTPASGDNLVERHLEDRGSAGPISPDEEKTLIGGGWSSNLK